MVKLLPSVRSVVSIFGWQVAEERLGSSTSPERQFVWGVLGVDNLILRDRPGSSERLYAFANTISVTAVVDASGTVVERYGYNAYGAVNVMTPAFAARGSSSYDWEILTNSYRYDVETGYYQVRNRYLHPTLGRWLTRDPIGYAGGLNLYAYCGNSPVNCVDALGLVRWAQLARGIGEIAGGAAIVAGFTVGEIATGGLATAGIVLTASAAGGLLSGGLGNVIVSFVGSEEQAEALEGAPTNIPELVARGIGGEPLQNMVGMASGVMGMTSGEESALEKAAEGSEILESTMALIQEALQAAQQAQTQNPAQQGSNPQLAPGQAPIEGTWAYQQSCYNL